MPIRLTHLHSRRFVLTLRRELEVYMRFRAGIYHCSCPEFDVRCVAASEKRAFNGVRSMLLKLWETGDRRLEEIVQSVARVA